jgi:hypothetical protein
MPAPLSGPGVGLALPQYLYPTELSNAPADANTNRLSLAAGDTWVIPAGTWYISLGSYLILQYLDPITGTWTIGAAPGWNGSFQYIKSDGFSVRIANLLACPVTATVTTSGSSYVQATTSIAVTGGGGATYLPIVGGALGTVASFATAIPTAGAGYGIAPILLIPPPPPAANNANGVGGIPATGYLTIANGTLSGISITNPGAGYPSAPTPVVVTSPFDPNISTGITQGAVALSLTSSGSLTGCLVTNSGAPLATITSYTLTVSGAGSGGTVTANFLQTVTAGSVSGQGTGYGTLGVLLTTTGGGPNTGSVTNPPDIKFRPRPAQINLAVTNLGTLATQVGTILDGGLFLGAPNPVLAVGALGGSLVGATLALTMGSVPDVAIVQPAP